MTEAAHAHDAKRERGDATNWLVTAIDPRGTMRGRGDEEQPSAELTLIERDQCAALHCQDLSRAACIWREPDDVVERQRVSCERACGRHFGSHALLRYALRMRDWAGALHRAFELLSIRTGPSHRLPARPSWASHDVGLRFGVGASARCHLRLPRAAPTSERRERRTQRSGKGWIFWHFTTKITPEQRECTAMPIDKS